MFDTSIAGNQAYQNQLNTELAQTIADQKAIEQQAQQGVSGLDKYKELLGERAGDTQKELAKFDYEPTIKQLQDINKQASSAYSAFEQASINNQGRPVLGAMIGGTESLIRRQQAVEIGALTSMAQALQGNITLAEKTAERAINDKYGAIEQQLGIEMAQLDYIYKDLDRIDKKRADTKLEALTERQRLVEEQKETEMNISNIMLSAAQSGANKDVLDSIMKSKTVGEAIVNSGKYLQETSKTNFLKFTDPETGEETYVDPNTGKAITAGKSDIENGILVDASGNAYNIASYATDPNHEANVQSALNRIGKMGSINDMNAYIKSKSPQSKVTGEMIASSAEKYGVSWEMMMAIMEADSNYADPRMNDQGQISSQGARQRAYRTKNPGNVGNVDSGSNVDRGTWEAGVDAVAKNLAWRKTTAPQKTVTDKISSLVELVKRNDLTPKEALSQVESKSDKDSLTVELAKLEINPIISDYNKDKAEMVIQNVDDLMRDVNAFNVGWGSLAKGVPTSSALNFASRLETLKSGIAFRELTAMREASKTGGALGQVSDNEGRLLQNALGALNQAQTPEQFRAELVKVKASIQRWQEAVGIYKQENNISNTNLSDLNFVI